MTRPRIIPILLLNDGSLVKTIRFGKYEYIGDPVNTVKIFNELQADELIILDIGACKQNKEPDFRLFEAIAKECFMPVTIGGGIRSVEHADKILSIGFEKISINTLLFEQPDIVREIIDKYGSQAVIGSIDVRRDIFGDYQVYVNSGKTRVNRSIGGVLEDIVNLRVGEILITNIDKEGTWSGIDSNLSEYITQNCTMPVIAHGGAGKSDHIKEILDYNKSSDIGIGSLFVFQKKDFGVLAKGIIKKLGRASQIS